ncbi:ABC-2 type transport system permease protein [Rheinheimera pacifica]|uniref:DUF3526 domain-containing protein n=1 Tax=Rheinheimera pacifica TaxID=173990 RepID=UPI002166CD4E|nr:DUF3526 domain-containing protein [Rheinheimera pacifica]MCS4306319.1 ABC-2 type transport system permease protein [Rheinheimera pacifica]
MSWLDICRETRFVLRKKSVALVLLVGFLLSLFSVWTGSVEVAQQHATLERIEQADKLDQADVTRRYDDYGSIAYYNFHLTYEPPSSLAFAALGVRDVYPWKHRIRMLAIEGQIHESDTQNPELALFGRIDFSFVIAVIAPLLLILLLHDLRASERAAGRLDFLSITARTAYSLWPLRATIVVLTLWLAFILPFIGGAIFNGVGAGLTLSVIAIVLLYILLWALLCYWVARFTFPAPVLASFLMGFWLLTTFVIPAVANVVIDKAIHGPQGGDILMTQREAVNDAWDIPIDTTMNAFVASHPEWAGKAQVNSLFEWKWYYAFQQLGDEAARPLAQAYQQTAEDKYRAAGRVAWLSPATLLQRALTGLAQTDAKAAWRYEQKVRQFHAQLRHFYYPLLFSSDAYNAEALDARPVFTPHK